MTGRLRRVAGLACVASIACADVALAGPAADDAAAAEALFKEARALVEAGDFAAGCPKFAESLALHASASTALNIARCHEHDGKLASAYASYQQALEYNGETRGAQRRKGLEELARAGLAALEPRLPRLRVVIEGGPEGLAIVRDGEKVPASALGETLPVDPGKHEVQATAPGYAPGTYPVELAEGETKTVTVALKALPKEPPPSDAEPRRGRVPAWAWATGAVGLGLVGASVYFLVDDLAAIDALRSNCREFDGGTYCDPGYDYAADNARKDRDLGLFIGLGSAGLIAITAAAVGIARGSSAKKKPRKAAAAPWLAPGSAGLSLVGRF